MGRECSRVSVLSSQFSVLSFQFSVFSFQFSVLSFQFSVLSERRDMSYTAILVAEEEGVRRITLNRPERRNAMTPEMQVELIRAMEEAASSNCRVVVFAGAGEGFCAGLDLNSLQQMNDKTAAEHTADAERVAR